MGGERGQASILIAIIFQVLFVFFAMVINVGLLVHDKINLQNSTDIAAYYAAMKQAEVLNSMAQLNYQIHQSWKLFNWRLWVLADAGRNSDYLHPSSGPGSIGSTPQSDAPATWSDAANYPVVCVTNPLWKQVSGVGENLCKNINLSLTPLVPPGLIGAQGIFAGVFNIFINGISQQNNLFKNDFSKTGLTNFKMAAMFLTSFKIAAARRRFAIHNLQQLLIASGTDFNDLTGQSVKATTQITLNNNLTASNKANGGATFEFQNGLNPQTPFMVPIEVRAFVPYLDFKIHSTVAAAVNQLDTASAQDPGHVLYNNLSAAWYSDYHGSPVPETASEFSGESEDFTSNMKSFDSLIGFEKNPWVLAYVKVSATTHPKMLFSPITSGSGPAITLTAESYAMPFGGKMGPWYYDSWPSGKDTSVPGNLVAPTDFSSPRVDVTATSKSIPNYSRYPGDKIGLSSNIARYVGLSQIINKQPPYSDYDNLADTDPSVDAIVAALPNSTIQPAFRQAEKAAVAPDLFDATYYSVAYDFPTRYPGAYAGIGGSGILKNFSGFDLGNDLPLAIQSGPSTIAQIFFPGTPPLWSGAPPFWIITQPQHLNTSWSQGDPGEYDAKQAPLSVGQTWENPGDPARKPAGGRAGYSVKLVSKHFLQRTDLPLGGQGSTGGILNAPPP